MRGMRDGIPVSRSVEGLLHGVMPGAGIMGSPSRMTAPLDFRDFCPRCGDEIDRTKPHAVKRVYCSLRCQIEYLDQLEKDARLEAKADRPPCERCSDPVPVHMDARARFCSHACQNAGGLDHRCANCGAAFKGSARRKYCSLRCAALKRERDRATKGKSQRGAAAD